MTPTAAAPSSPEQQALQAIAQTLQAERIACPDYSRAYPAKRINQDPGWACLLIPSNRDNQVFSAALLVALNRSYPARLAKVFSALEPNPDCACQRFATYYRRDGALVAWSFSYLSTQPYGTDMVLWSKHEVLP